jgi:hypothetical protein
MTITEEVNIWIAFWVGSTFIFMVLFYIIELYYYLKKNTKDETKKRNNINPTR